MKCVCVCEHVVLCLDLVYRQTNINKNSNTVVIAKVEDSKFTLRNILRTMTLRPLRAESQHTTLLYLRPGVPEERNRVVQEGGRGEQFICQEEADQLLNLLPGEFLVSYIGVLCHKHHRAWAKDGTQAGRARQHSPQSHRPPQGHKLLLYLGCYECRHTYS